MDKRQRTCCFTGHRSFRSGERERVQENLEHCLRKLIETKEVRYFGAGGALGFDTLAAQAVLELKKTYGHIRLILVLPCRDQAMLWKPADVKVYDSILRQADKTVYTAESYYEGCMQRRNRHLVDNAAWCVCYQHRKSGGTASTVAYARQKGLVVLNCAGW